MGDAPAGGTGTGKRRPDIHGWAPSPWEAFATNDALLWVGLRPCHHGAFGVSQEGSEPVPLSKLRADLIAILQDRGLTRCDPPIRLASGDLSHEFIDTKRALASGAQLRLASQAVVELVADMGVEFDSVGGLTMGADHIAHGVAMLSDVEWFSVRKQTKERGTKKRIEGADLQPGRRVLLVDDVVTRGGSIADALEAIRGTGATVVAAVSLVDRGRFGRPLFAKEAIPYQPLVTFEDLDIQPVGDESPLPSATG